MSKDVTGVYANTWCLGKHIACAGTHFAKLSKDHPERTKELMNVKVNGKSISDYFDTPEKLIDFIDLVVESTDFLEEQLERMPSVECEN